MTSVINIIRNSFPAKLLPSAIKFKNAYRKINFFQCKVHPILKLNSEYLIDFTYQYLLKLSLSSRMMCLKHTLFIEHMSSTCHRLKIILSKQCLANFLPRIANTNVLFPGKTWYEILHTCKKFNSPNEKLALGVATNLWHYHTKPSSP